MFILLNRFLSLRKVGEFCFTPCNFLFRLSL
jgi:hypothetical protein